MELVDWGFYRRGKGFAGEFYLNPCWDRDYDRRCLFSLVEHYRTWMGWARVILHGLSGRGCG